MAEPGFFFQTLTNSFVDWVFGRLDSYIQDKPDESNKTQDEKISPKAGEPSEKKVSILDFIWNYYFNLLLIGVPLTRHTSHILGIVCQELS